MICADNHLVQHVVDQLNLVRDLGSTENGQEWPVRSLKSLGEELELLLDEETGSSLGEFDTDHAGVSTMGSTEGIVDVDITELGEALTESGDCGGVSLGLGTVLVLDGTLLLDVETQVLEENDGSRGSGVYCFFDIGADTVVEEYDRLSDETLEFGGDGFQREFGDDLSIGASEMGHQDNRGCAYNTQDQNSSKF